MEKRSQISDGKAVLSIQVKGEDSVTGTDMERSRGAGGVAQMAGLRPQIQSPVPIPPKKKKFEASFCWV
jgi:hypothetical protein